MVKGALQEICLSCVCPGLEGTVERFIAVPVSPSLMAHQLQLLQSQTTNLENVSPSRTCTALVSAQVGGMVGRGELFRKCCTL